MLSLPIQPVYEKGRILLANSDPSLNSPCIRPVSVREIESAQRSENAASGIRQQYRAILVHWRSEPNPGGGHPTHCAEAETVRPRAASRDKMPVMAERSVRRRGKAGNKAVPQRTFAATLSRCANHSSWPGRFRRSTQEAGYTTAAVPLHHQTQSCYSGQAGGVHIRSG